MDLIKKSLVTYALKKYRISEQGGSGESSTWLDVLFCAKLSRWESASVGIPISDIWTREFHKPLRSPYFLSTFNLTVDTFFNPYEEEFREVNTDAFIQGHQELVFSVLDSAIPELGHECDVEIFGLRFHLMKCLSPRKKFSILRQEELCACLWA